LITGGITFEQVNETYKYICDFLEKHKDIIKKPPPNTNMPAIVPAVLSEVIEVIDVTPVAV
jgi:hypothetical protein